MTSKKEKHPGPEDQDFDNGLKELNRLVFLNSMERIP
jgi:hypothetical protein